MDLQKRWQTNLLAAFLFSTLSFAELQDEKMPLQDQNKTFENLNTEKSDVKSIIGAVENVRLVPPNVVLKARIDTGAKTTSVDARGITAFERDGDEWVRFVFHFGKKEHMIERKVLRTIFIKRHGQEPQRRYVVNMRIVLGDVSQLIEVTLNNRKTYTYPVLIGRNFLRDNFIVDVSKKHQLKPMVLPK